MAKPFKKLADMFGYALIKHAKNYTSFEYYFINATKKFDIQYIIDVGANCGQYALKVRKLGYKGNIVSFEPIRDNYQKILSVAEYDPKWQCYNYALGASEGQGLIHVFRNTDLSSFL
jgi:hypothetical protein